LQEHTFPVDSTFQIPLILNDRVKQKKKGLLRSYQRFLSSRQDPAARAAIAARASAMYGVSS
jgi:hypothetical protein